jgi:hypothetical protein
MEKKYCKDKELWVWQKWKEANDNAPKFSSSLNKQRQTIGMASKKKLWIV